MVSKSAFFKWRRENGTEGGGERKGKGLKETGRGRGEEKVKGIEGGGKRREKKVPDVLSLLLSTIASLPGNWATY